MRGVRRHGADFQMKHWAEYTGLPKSTFYDRLKTGDMVKVAAATREAMVLTGQHDCARAALVMGKAVLFIERLVDEGKAKVEDLAKALNILRAPRCWGHEDRLIPSLGRVPESVPPRRQEPAGG